MESEELLPLLVLQLPCKFWNFCYAMTNNVVSNFSMIVVQQDHVPESDRCVVGGVQNSLQSLLDLLTYVMGTIISDPRVNIFSFFHQNTLLEERFPHLSALFF